MLINNMFVYTKRFLKSIVCLILINLNKIVHDKSTIIDAAHICLFLLVSVRINILEKILNF